MRGSRTGPGSRFIIAGPVSPGTKGGSRLPAANEAALLLDLGSSDERKLVHTPAERALTNDLGDYPDLRSLAGLLGLRERAARDDHTGSAQTEAYAVTY
jgi:hypothetical protein